MDRFAFLIEGTSYVCRIKWWTYIYNIYISYIWTGKIKSKLILIKWWTYIHPSYYLFLEGRERGQKRETFFLSPAPYQLWARRGLHSSPLQIVNLREGVKIDSSLFYIKYGAMSKQKMFYRSAPLNFPQFSYFCFKSILWT